VDEITHEITLDSDLTEEPRERLLEIANRCPVHRALTNGVLVLV
jgi:putative redox protein